MSIGIQNMTLKHRGNALLSSVLVVVYLLVVFYSISHVHLLPEQAFRSDISQQPSRLLELAHHIDESSTNWHSDSQYTQGCTLVAQVAASLSVQKHQTMFVSVYHDVHRPLSFKITTPIKKVTRAPPAVRA